MVRRLLGIRRCRVEGPKAAAVHVGTVLLNAAAVFDHLVALIIIVLRITLAIHVATILNLNIRLQLSIKCRTNARSSILNPKNACRSSVELMMMAGVPLPASRSTKTPRANWSVSSVRIHLCYDGDRETMFSVTSHRELWL
jgi:hypothetical protein